MTGDQRSECAESTPSAELERKIMNSNVPKNEREWWAAREIERLREALGGIVRRYERIMGEPPDWTDFDGPNDERLRYAREAWFGAAQIAREALHEEQSQAGLVP